MIAFVLIAIFLIFAFAVVVGAKKPNALMICPHCSTRGRIQTKQVKLRKGISGGKATAALLTGGLSLVATGLSRREKATRAHCGACNSVWHY